MATTTTNDTKTVDGLMAMFYAGACKRNTVVLQDKMKSFSLTAKQFSWLCDISRREDGFTARGRTGRAVVQGEIAGVGCFEANEQKYGSATVIIRQG